MGAGDLGARACTNLGPGCERPSPEASLSGWCPTLGPPGAGRDGAGSEGLCRQVMLNRRTSRDRAECGGWGPLMVSVSRWCQILGPPGVGTVEEQAGRGAEGLTPPRLCCSMRCTPSSGMRSGRPPPAGCSTTCEWGAAPTSWGGELISVCRRGSCGEV